MSYADVTARNAHQTPEEARAAPVPELVHHEATSTTSLIDVDSPHVASVPSDFDSQSVQTETQAARIEREQQAEATAQEARNKAQKKAAQAKSAARRRAGQLQDNRDHPVVLGNAVLSVALLGGLGYGAYAKFRAGEFSWKVVGVGAAIVSAFSVVDYYASQYLFSKYPPKK